jgi:hypothetical protein
MEKALTGKAALVTGGSQVSAGRMRHGNNGRRSLNVDRASAD